MLGLCAGHTGSNRVLNERLIVQDEFRGDDPFRRVRSCRDHRSFRRVGHPVSSSLAYSFSYNTEEDQRSDAHHQHDADRDKEDLQDAAGRRLSGALGSSHLRFFFEADLRRHQFFFALDTDTLALCFRLQFLVLDISLIVIDGKSTSAAHADELSVFFFQLTIAVRAIDACKFHIRTLFSQIPLSLYHVALYMKKNLPFGFGYS